MRTFDHYIPKYLLDAMTYIYSATTYLIHSFHDMANLPVKTQPSDIILKKKMVMLVCDFFFKSNWDFGLKVIFLNRGDNECL